MAYGARLNGTARGFKPASSARWSQRGRERGRKRGTMWLVVPPGSPTSLRRGYGRKVAVLWHASFSIGAGVLLLYFVLFPLA